jgi:hypothetical protein
MDESVDRHEVIRRDSAAYRELHRKIHEAFAHRDEGREAGQAWKAACEAFHVFESPMFEVLTEDGQARLKAGDAEMVDWAVAYLEVDPFHFRSGYHKTLLVRRLKWLVLLPEHQERLRVVVLRALDHPRRAAGYYSRLAASLQSPEFLERMRWRLQSSDPEIRRCASRLLDYCDAFNRTMRRVQPASQNIQ